MFPDFCTILQTINKNRNFVLAFHLKEYSKSWKWVVEKRLIKDNTSQNLELELCCLATRGRVASASSLAIASQTMS